MMKILVFGADGFIGRKVVESLSTGHDVYRATRHDPNIEHDVRVDLTRRESIVQALEVTKPEVIINCAGMVDTTQDVSLNEKFTVNIIESILAAEYEPERIIILGSAAEYGVINPGELPISETAALRANTPYGLSKIAEESAALRLGRQYRLPVVVARIFNPLGPGMHPKFFTSRLMGQIAEVADGKRETIEVGRLDAARDYIDVRDVAAAIRVLSECTPHELVYNVGSGKSTSNKELVELMLDNSGLSDRPRIVETSAEPEPTVASQANIERIEKEFDWTPEYSVNDTVKEIMNNADKR